MPMNNLCKAPRHSDYPRQQISRSSLESIILKEDLRDELDDQRLSGKNDGADGIPVGRSRPWLLTGCAVTLFSMLGLEQIPLCVVGLAVLVRYRTAQLR